MSSPAPIGVQLYSLREAIKNDLEGVMRRLAKIGYVGVEPYAALDHATAARLCSDLGLEIPSAHLRIPLGDDKSATLDAAAIYKLKRVIVPWQPPETFASVDNIRRFCDRMGEAASVAADNGLELGYHNHDFECQLVDGRPAYRIMLEHLAPEIFLQVDTYWMQVGGIDVLKMIRDLGQRARSLHIKDGPGVRGEPMVAVGDGVMGVPAIVGVSKAEWLIVEIDDCATDMMTAVEKSYQYMVKEGLARGRNDAAC